MKKNKEAPEWITAAPVDRNSDAEGKYCGPQPVYATTIGRTKVLLADPCRTTHRSLMFIVSIADS
jgi:hypothetical protein